MYGNMKKIKNKHLKTRMLPETQFDVNILKLKTYFMDISD